AALPKLQILLTAGNHDAPARLEAPSPLLDSLRITVVGTIPSESDSPSNPSKFLVPLRDASGTVAAIALAVPFLRPSDVPPLPDAANPYGEGVAQFYRQLTEQAESLRSQLYPGAALLALGHCHIQDALESRDSERSLVIGGSESLPTSLFPPALCYVALGHLHRPQSLDGGRIRYSGSPIPLSFSEKDYPHALLEVELDGPRLIRVTPLPIPRAVSLLRIPERGALPLEELLHEIRTRSFPTDLPAEQHPFLEIRVLDDGPDPSRRRRIEEALADKPVRLASLRLESRKPAGAIPHALANATLEELVAMNPEEILRSAHRELYQTEPEPEVLSALAQILRETAL
ncbi:MAG: exonuclease subunit SbcD, partial [Verrucomicrobiota bacterium]